MRYFLVLALLLSISAHAEQSYFNKNEDSQNIRLSYRWQDQLLQPRTLTFSLPKSVAINQFRNKKTYKSEIAQRYVYVELMKQARTINPKDARINIRQIGQNIELKVSARSPAETENWLKTLQDFQYQAFDSYLQENHYTRFFDYMGKEGVIPDHVRYITESHNTLLPAAQAIYDQLTPGSETRDYLNLLLSWVQSIPYDTLENRFSSNGSGFSSPLDVLIQNLGDCDSKATLTATLMRSLLPNLSLVIVYLPDHALLAVNLGHRSDDMLIDVRGTPHVLLDPTGPRLMSLGEVSTQTAASIASGTFTYVIVP